jgi:hypothetical protein
MSARLLAALALVVVLVGCSGDTEGSAPRPSPTPTSSEAAPTPTRAPALDAPPTPKRGVCHRMSYDDAVSPTASAGPPVPFRRTHTAETFGVGELDTVAAGRLFAVDSERVQAQVARTCPRRLAEFVGGTEEQRRLSMIRSVWFTPTVEQSDAGAGWYRCDVVALARDGTLLPVTGSLAGVLDTEPGRQRFGVCGTAEPGTKGFRRVVCDRPHSWRAIRTVPLDGTAYPGEARAESAVEGPCRAAGEAAAADPLDYRWGYEFPTGEQWRAGRTWGLCWVPD